MMILSMAEIILIIKNNLPQTKFILHSEKG